MSGPKPGKLAESVQTDLASRRQTDLVVKSTLRPLCAFPRALGACICIATWALGPSRRPKAVKPPRRARGARGCVRALPEGPLPLLSHQHPLCSPLSPTPTCPQTPLLYAGGQAPSGGATGRPFRCAGGAAGCAAGCAAGGAAAPAAASAASPCCPLGPPAALSQSPRSLRTGRFVTKR